MKRSQIIITFLFVLLLIPISSFTIVAQTRGAKKPANPAPDNDIKIRVRNVMEGQSYESTQSIKGVRERNEMGIGQGLVNLTQCDLQRTIQINDQMKTYLIQSMNDGGLISGTPADNRKSQSPSQPQAQRGGVVTITNTITDTGERKEMFGFTARHLKTSMVSESSPEACDQNKMHMETDGWYIDLNYGLDCQTRAAQAQSRAYGGKQCQDDYRYKNVGSGKLGFPLDSITTIYNANGTRMVMRREVIELSRASLEASLFEIPAGYTEAKDYQQLMGVQTHQAAAPDYAGRNAVTERPSSTPSGARQTAEAKAALGPKKVNVIRIGVVLPKTQMGQGFERAEVAEPLRNTMTQYLNGPAVEIVALDSRSASQIDLEAKEKECDFVLQSSLTQKQGGGGGIGGFMRKVSPVANVIPVAGSTGSAAGALASSIATTVIYTAADLSGNFKVKDEVTFEYRLTTVSNNVTVLTASLKAKAKSDREDLLSPIIEQMAKAVLNAAVIR
jgi:hypothetical protein